MAKTPLYGPTQSKCQDMRGAMGCYGVPVLHLQGAVLWHRAEPVSRHIGDGIGVRWSVLNNLNIQRRFNKVNKSCLIHLDLRAVYLWCDLSNDVQGLLEQAVVWNPLKSTLHMHGTTWNQLESARKNLSTFVDDLAFTVSLLRLANLPKQGNQKLNDLRE